MALITCPECGAQISSTAKKCIKCGVPLESDQPAVSNTVATSSSEKKSNSKIIFGVLGGVIILLVAGVAYFITHQGPSLAELEAKEKVKQDSVRKIDSMFDAVEMKKSMEDALLAADDSAANTLSQQASDEAHAPADSFNRDLSYVRKYIGKYPQDGLFNDNEIMTRVKLLVGRKYYLLKENLSVVEPGEKDGTFFIQRGIAPHQGGSEEGIIVIDMGEGYIYAGIISDNIGFHQVYSEENSMYPYLGIFKKWLDDHYQNCSAPMDSTAY